MDNDTIVDHITNAFGNPNFNLDSVLNSLREKIEEMQANGENTGSLLALSNLLPDIEREAKERY